MIEDIGRAINVVEALGGQGHCHVIAAVKEGHHLQEELLRANLIGIENRDQLRGADPIDLTVDHVLDCIVKVSGLTVNFTLSSYSPAHVLQLGNVHLFNKLPT